jgi:pyruvate formate lyase activating enzyme
VKKRDFIKTGLIGLGCSCLPAAELIAGTRAPTDLWKWSKEALFYEVTPRGVKCMICPNECTLKPEELSDCHNRINKEDKLYTIAYGNPCSVNVDPIEKKPLYHFLPASRAFSIATAGCNLACLNCQNWTISQISPTETRNYDLMPFEVVNQTIANNCESIAYTYSEPITYFEYTYDTSKIARSKKIKNVLVSAGYINEAPLRYLAQYIDAANIDLKSFSESIYLKLNAGKLNPILNSLKILKESGVWLEITNLIVPSWTDDLEMIRAMCKWLYSNGFADTPLHFSRFHPMYKLTQLPATSQSVLESARNIALSEGLKFIYIGNVPGTDASNTHCPGCKKLLVERRGYQIIQVNIEQSRCKFCKELIPGIWQ